MIVAPWTDEERAWASESFRAGDGIAEIADASGRPFLDVAACLNVYGFVQRERRWVRSGDPVSRRRWVSGVLKEVAVYRCRHGDDPRDLADIARAEISCMYLALKGLVKRRRRLPPRSPLALAAGQQGAAA